MDCQGWTLMKIGNPLPPQKKREKKRRISKEKNTYFIPWELPAQSQ